MPAIAGVTGDQLAVTVSYPPAGSELKMKMLRTPDGAREALTVFAQKGGDSGTGGFALDTYLMRIGASAVERDALVLSKQRGPLSPNV